MTCLNFTSFILNCFLNRIVSADIKVMGMGIQALAMALFGK